VITERQRYTSEKLLKAFEFYDNGKPLMIIYSRDCWQTLALLQQNLQKPFYYNTTFKQVKPWVDRTT
jgi:hypothetical protein